jgi:hypothetical protein
LADKLAVGPSITASAFPLLTIPAQESHRDRNRSRQKNAGQALAPTPHMAVWVHGLQVSAIVKM